MTVNTTADTNVRDNVLTLREALLIHNQVLQQNQLTAAEQAQVAAALGNQDLIRFSITGTITLGSALPSLGTVRIQGPGQNRLTVRRDPLAQAQFTIFTIGQTGNAAISGLTIANGRNPGSGGGVSNLGGSVRISGCTLRGNRASSGGGVDNLNGTMNLENTLFDGNEATAGDGGAVSNSGSMTLRGVRIRNSLAALGPNDSGRGGGLYNTGLITESRVIELENNRARSHGGAVYNAGQFRDTGLEARNNRAGDSPIGQPRPAADGGGVYNATGSNLNLTNAALVGNNTSRDGGGLYNNGVATAERLTVSGNRVERGGRGSGIFHTTNSTSDIVRPTITDNEEETGDAGAGALGVGVSAAVYIEPGAQASYRNSIIAGNRGGPFPDVFGLMQSGGHNLIGVGEGGSGYAASDQFGTSVNPLDPKLGPLGDHGGITQTHLLLPGSPALNAGDNAAAGTSDQRGFAPVVNGAADVGAVEIQPADLGTEPYAQVSGRAWHDTNGNGIQDSGEPGLEGVFVYLYDSAGNLIGRTETDATGAFAFAALPAGSYGLNFQAPAESYGFSPQDQGGNDLIDSDVNTSGGVGPFSLSPGANKNDLAAGLVSLW